MSSDLKNLPDFVGAVTLVVARIALRLSVERRQYFVEGDGRRELEDGLSRFFEGTSVLQPSVVKIATYPADGVSFDLTIERFSGIDLVGRFGYDNQDKWKCSRKEIIEPQTKKFMLVSIGYQPNWEAVKKAFAQYGEIPEGQWCDAFKKAFPNSDGKGHIGVADASWVGPRGGAFFPCVSTVGGPNFGWAGDVFNARWRWLVEAQA